MASLQYPEAYRHPQNEVSPRIYCHYPYTSLFVTLDGKVRPCCFAAPIGDLTESDDIFSIWNGESIRAVRENLLRGDLNAAGCSQCGFIGRRDIASFPFSESLGQSDAIQSNIILQQQEYISGSSIVKSLPSHVVIQATEACNLRCKMCFQQHDAVHVSDIVFDKTLACSEVYDEIQFTGGEPFVSMKVRKFLLDFKSTLGQKLSFATNGSLLAQFRQKLEELPRLHLGISIDAATEETYSKIRIGGSWSELTRNVEWYATQRMKKRPFWDSGRLAFVILKSNYEEIPKFVEWARDLQMPVLFAPVWGEFAEGENIFSEKKLRDGLTSPSEIVKVVKEICKSMPDRERQETVTSLEYSLNQLKEGGEKIA